MKYLVLRAKGEASTLQVVNEGAQIKGPFESWALRTGKQIVFVDTKMYKLLKQYHMHGSYTNGAWFGYSFEDMRAILTEHIGPCDRERYEQELIITAAMKQPAVRGKGYWAVVSHFVQSLIMFLLTASFMVVKFVAFMLLIPFLLHWINKNRDK